MIKRYPYEAMTTPYEKFKSLPEASCYLKPGVTLDGLETIAQSVSDNAAAKQMNAARDQLFKVIFASNQHVA